MRFLRTPLTLAFLFLLTLSIGEATAANPHSYWKKANTSKSQSSPREAKDGLKPFDDLVKDLVKIEGLFTFYHDTTDNSVLMAVRPDQLGVVYMCGLSLSHGDGAFSEGARMYYEFPFYFSRIGKKMQMLEKNVRIRADSTSEMYASVQAGISDGLIAATAIKSLPQDSTKAVLVEADAFFIRDVQNIGYHLGQEARLGIRMDGGNSYFGEIKSFPENAEIDVHLHFLTQQPQSATALQNPFSFFHVYHFSLSSIPASDYVPRLADERVGYFQTYFQEYNRIDSETPYVRYINRWDLRKEFPDARVSDPVKPIVYWIENTVPVEYRDAIAEGIEMWNLAFEKIGIRNAMVAKIMPDTASWDPTDVRYNCVRWLVAKNYPYVAIGPSWANPYTGEIYAADVGIVADGIRSFYTAIERRVRPLAEGALTTEEYDPFYETPSTEDHWQEHHYCDPISMAHEAAFGVAYLQAVEGMANVDSLTEEYIHAFLTFLVAHEVGHTLGFRHNFIASAINDLATINDPQHTTEHSSIGSFMEYPAANIAGPGRPQGEFYPSKPGPYDYWLVEYGYANYGAKTPEEEIERLIALAARAPEQGLQFATDEDAYGTSVKSIDPRVNVWDLGDDPLAFLEHEISLSQEIWSGLISRYEKPGERYQTVREVFGHSLSPYHRAAIIAPKYIGGLYHNRFRIGDADSVLPFTVVPASEQRRAMTFISDRIFSCRDFSLPADLQNKLQGELMEDFEGSVYNRSSIDYPFCQQIMQVHQGVLTRLYSPYVLSRLVNNVERVKSGDEVYTIYDMFTDVRRAIWGELTAPENISNLRRQLQIAHLDRVVFIYLSPGVVHPPDARTLAANDLDVLESSARRALESSAIDNMTKAHLKEVIRQIEAAKNARREYSER